MSAHVFRVLFEDKRAGTLLLDLDPQFNLTQTLFTREAYDKLRAEKNTISSVMEPPSDLGLFSVKTTSEPPPDPEKLAQTKFHFAGAQPPVELAIIPGDFQLAKYSLMDDNKQLGSVRDRFMKFVEKAKETYRVVVIDCNPSSSFLTLCALQACTHVLVPVRPDRYSVLGLEILSEFIDGVPTISPKPHLIIAMNGMPRTRKRETSAIEAELRAHDKFGSKTLANVLKVSSHLIAKTDYTGFATDRKGSWTKVLRSEIAALAGELSTKIGL
ncbi:hypothetical protein RLEG3_13780 [Rhizobium leguminosarum bv. trifolii WSM1689]|nr:hypothetical protein RLEG3_13780 [Rhizobium leguminosarum bv. trifolii WSM1689]